MRRVISLWLPRLTIDRLRRRNPGRNPARSPHGHAPSPEPLVVMAPSAGRLLVDAVDPAAAAAGLRPGMPLADARAVLPELAAVEADGAADRRLLDDLADWCGRYTPWVAAEPEILQGAGGIWLDVSGCAHLFGGEAALLADLLRRLAGFGILARAAVADTPGAAWALARFDAAAAAGLVCPPGGARVALDRLPVAGLRLAPAQVTDLERFGLTRIGSLYDLARGPLTARFGPQPARRLEQALGQLREPISPRRPVPPHRVRRGFAEPIATIEALTAALRSALGELAHGLERRSLGARRLELAVWRLDGAVRRLAIGTHRAVRDPDHLARLLREHLDKLDVTAGVEVLTVAAGTVERVAPSQLALDATCISPAFAGESGASIPNAGPPPALAPLLDRLANRLGGDAVTRPVARASHLPERAQIQLPLMAPTPAAPPAPALASAPHRPRAARPPRLLARPEPIEATALMPDDPPRQFSWRGRTHRVRRAEGPERIAPEWWREDAAARDYYRVEDTDGHRFWLYRDGPYGTPAPGPRWYLHGLFG